MPEQDTSMPSDEMRRLLLHEQALLSHEEYGAILDLEWADNAIGPPPRKNLLFADIDEPGFGSTLTLVWFDGEKLFEGETSFCSCDGFIDVSCIEISIDYLRDRLARNFESSENADSEDDRNKARRLTTKLERAINHLNAIGWTKNIFLKKFRSDLIETLNSGLIRVIAMRNCRPSKCIICGDVANSILLLERRTELKTLAQHFCEKCIGKYQLVSEENIRGDAS